MKYEQQLQGFSTMSYPYRRRWLAVLLAFLFTASACGGTNTATSVSGQTSNAASSTDLFDGEFETVSGETIDLASLQGQDTVLWFWAPW